MRLVLGDELGFNCLFFLIGGLGSRDISARCVLWWFTSVAMRMS